MGLVLLGIAALNPAGLQGAMFMMVSSGLLTALLFFLIGAIKDRTDTSLIPQLGGLSRSMPVLSGFLLVAALGSLGLPLTSGFISEIQAFIGGFDTYPRISAVGVLGVILSAVYLLYAMQRTTFGPLESKYGQLADATPREYVPAVVLTALVLLIGIYPNVVGHLFNLSVNALMRIGG
jgi:NADH-quinone oxidoreductase subunit M